MKKSESLSSLTGLISENLKKWFLDTLNGFLPKSVHHFLGMPIAKGQYVFLSGTYLRSRDIQTYMNHKTQVGAG
jgi:hypothetical protein